MEFQKLLTEVLITGITHCRVGENMSLVVSRFLKSSNSLLIQSFRELSSAVSSAWCERMFCCTYTASYTWRGRGRKQEQMSRVMKATTTTIRKISVGG